MNTDAKKKPGLLDRLKQWLEKADRKLEEKSKQKPCCSPSGDRKKGGSCCS